MVINMKKKIANRILGLVLAGAMVFTASDFTVLSKAAESVVESETDVSTKETELAEYSAQEENNVLDDSNLLEENDIPQENDTLENNTQYESITEESTVSEGESIPKETSTFEENSSIEETKTVEITSTEEYFDEDVSMCETDEENTSFDVYFNANGGYLDDYDSMTVNNGDAYGELPVPHRYCYTFEGWFTERENGNQITSDMIVELNQDITLYARWTAKVVSTPTVEVKVENGSWIDENAVIYLLSQTPDAKIYYTTNGVDPYESDDIKLYTDGIKVKDVMRDSGDPNKPEKIVKIKAYAIKNDFFDSEIVSFEYNVETDYIRWGDITEEDRKEFATDAKPEGDSSLVPSGMWIGGIDKNGYDYSGKNITFVSGTEDEIRVYDGKKLLKVNQDYTISYKNNVNAYSLKDGDTGYNELAAPSVIITGKGNYSGSITETFVINPIDLSTVNSDGTPFFKALDITLAYNGSVQKGTTKITYINDAGKEIALKEGKDFSYTYPGTNSSEEGYNASAFKDASEIPYVVIVNGKGNYKGTLTFNQIITSAVLISKAKVSSIPAQKYNDGAAIEPELSIKYGGNELKKYNEETGTGDYTLKYINNIKPGTARVIITGKGAYGGTHEVTFKIDGINMKDAKIENFQSSYVYSCSEVKQDNVKISYVKDSQAIELKENEHYKVQYLNNKKAGTATVIYTGITSNGWTGTIKKTFKITPYDMKGDMGNRIDVIDDEGYSYPTSVIFVKGGAKPVPIVKFTAPNGQKYTLKEGVDYKVSYINNKRISEGAPENKMPAVKIVGMGNFKGAYQNVEFLIEKSDIRNLSITALDVVYKNKKGNFKTSITVTDTDGCKLKAGTDYDKNVKYYYYNTGAVVSENDIVPVGTMLRVEVTGKGLYTGDGDEPSKLSGVYRVVNADISKATIKVNNQYYTGKPIRPDKDQISITLNKKVLSEQDYEIVSYSNNINKGKAKITIKGVGNYGGSKTVNFTINNKSMCCLIVFNGNGATSGTMKDMQIKPGADYVLAKNTYKRNGGTFKGWNTKPDGSGTDIDGNVILYANQANTPIKIQKKDLGKTIVLYAQWDMEKFTIKYELNGGTNNELNPSVYTVEDEIALKDPVKEGYTFMGWYTDNKYTKKIDSIQKGSSGNITLYAKWMASVVGKVEIPEQYLNVLDFGAVPNDGIDDTDQIEDAIRKASSNANNGGINTVYVPAGEYKITPGDANNDGEPGILVRSNVNLVMDNDAVLMVEPSAYKAYCVLSIKNAENISINGGKIRGERYKHLGTGGEAGHGIALFGARNVDISNVSVASNWGDGIYLSTQAVKQPDESQLYLGCDNVTITNCEVYDNRRNNISIVDVDNVTIDNCHLFDAHGTAPQCGIDVEPNTNSSGDRICRNILLRNTTISAYQNKNDYRYMCFMTHHNPYVPNYTTSENIRFENCTFNGYVGNYSGNNLTFDDKTVFNGTFENKRK